MKKIQLVLIFIVFLTANNLVLLSMLGYFEEAKPMVSEKVEIVNANSEPAPIEKTVSGKASVNFETEAPEASNAHQQQLTTAIERYVASDEFTEAMDVYQSKSGPRFLKLQRKFRQMSAPDLYESVLESENPLEKNMALQVLSQGKMAQLEAAELRNLYLDPDVTDWSRAQVLQALLEKDDPDGLLWAKRALSEDSLGMYSGGEVYMGVYDKDPEFFKNYIKQVDIEKKVDLVSVVSFLSQEPELLKLYYETNLDKILSSENPNVFLNWSPNIDIDLSKSQQSGLAELFGSSNRKKRNFASSFLNSMDDIDILREAYTQLSKSRERQVFVSSLFYNKDNSEKRELARELASSSDDPKIQQLIQEK